MNHDRLARAADLAWWCVLVPAMGVTLVYLWFANSPLGTVESMLLIALNVAFTLTAVLRAAYDESTRQTD